jgi:hypothetical protein
VASADRVLRAPHSEANAAYKRHLAARRNAQRVALEAADSVVEERLARQARSLGVKLSV